MRDVLAGLCVAVWLGGSGVSFAEEAQVVNPEETADAIRRVAQSYHDAGLFDGTMFYAKDGKVWVAEGYGLANQEFGAKNTPQTKYYLASVTKVFTAAMIAKLIEEGALNEVTPIGGFFPNLRDDLKPITIGNLLHQRSGLPREFAEYFPDSRDFAKTIDDVIGRLNVAPLLFEPGSRQNYSNANYLLLGEIITRVKGGSYESNLRKMILEPAGMSDTAVDHPAEIVPGRAVGYSPRLVTDLARAEIADWRVQTMPGAGGVYSTAEDLYRFDQAMRAGKILSAETQERMLTPIDGLGYSWEIHEFGPEHFAFMSGAAREGQLSAYVRFTERDAVLVILANNDAPGRGALPSLGRNSLFAMIDPNMADPVPPIPPLRRTLELLFAEGEEAAAAYYATLEKPETVKNNAGPLQATGAPDAEAGESSLAWASETPNDQAEWLDLTYATPARAKAVHVYQTQNPGAVSSVTLTFVDGKSKTIQAKKTRMEVSERGVVVSIIPVSARKKVSQVRLHIDAPSVLGWNQIDAVGLEARDGEVQWAVDAKASSAEYLTREPNIFAVPTEWSLLKTGRTYMEFGRAEEAAQIFRFAKRLFPESEDASVLLTEAEAQI